MRLTVRYLQSFLPAAILPVALVTASVVPATSPACSPSSSEVYAAGVIDLGVVAGSGVAPVVKAKRWNTPEESSFGCGGDESSCSFSTFTLEIESERFIYAFVDAPSLGHPRYLRVASGNRALGLDVREVEFGALETQWLLDGLTEFDLAVVDDEGRRTETTRVTVPGRPR